MSRVTGRVEVVQKVRRARRCEIGGQITWHVLRSTRDQLLVDRPLQMVDQIPPTIVLSPPPLPPSPPTIVRLLRPILPPPRGGGQVSKIAKEGEKPSPLRPFPPSLPRTNRLSRETEIRVEKVGDKRGGFPRSVQDEVENRLDTTRPKLDGEGYVDEDLDRGLEDGRSLDRGRGSGDPSSGREHIGIEERVGHFYTRVEGKRRTVPHL